MANDSSRRASVGHPRSERRKYPRIPTDQVLTIAPEATAGLSARGRDLSPGGIQFRVIGCEISLGEALTVTFQVGGDRIVASGRVVWATETDAWVTDVGLEFQRVEGDGFALLEAMTLAYEPVEDD